LKKLKRYNGMIRGIKIVTFGGILVLMGFIGLLWFARPKTSVVEKRNLTQFPTLTWSSFWDGSFFKGVDTWYADTFPIRDLLISGNQSLQERYGIKSDQIVGNAAMVADEIPDADATPRPQPSAAPTPTPSPSEEPLEDGTVSVIGEMQGNIYITDNAGYELYYFAQDGADTFASTMNQFYTNVKDKVNLYVMIIPISSGVMLDVYDLCPVLSRRLYDPPDVLLQAFETIKLVVHERLLHVDHDQFHKNPPPALRPRFSEAGAAPGQGAPRRPVSRFSFPRQSPAGGYSLQSRR